MFFLVRRIREYDRRRGAIRSFGMVAPSRARRLPASRSIRARSPRCTNAVFSFSPVNLRASASKSSSMFNVVLIHIMMHVSYAHCKDFVSDVGFGAPPKQSFLLFCWPAREMGALPQPCRLALRVTAKQLLAAPILALHDITPILGQSHPPGFSAVFLRRVFGSGDHSVADQTLDRAGAAHQ